MDSEKLGFIYCFLDTNILLEFTTFDEVDWPKVLSAKQVCLVLAPIVLRELDKHKTDYHNSRRQNRARMLLSKLSKIFDTTNQAIYIRPNVTMMILPKEPFVDKPEDWVKEGLDQNISDDRLLASILDFMRQHPSEKILLLSDDSGPRFKARSHNIQSLAPSDGLIRLAEQVPNQKQTLIKDVEGLVPGVNISVYQDKFGKPMFTQSLTEKNIKEYVFVNPHFYLDAVTNSSDAVLYFSVTIRDETFQPIFKSPGYPKNQPSFQITLGVSTFGDIPTLPEYIISFLGAHDFSYYETRYFGNPGHYQYFGFGLNQSGYFSSNAKAYISVFANNALYGERVWAITEQNLAILEDFRTKVAFNTYAVSAPSVVINNYAGFNLGVNYYQVRTLNP
jgi:hypothetical protein